MLLSTLKIYQSLNKIGWDADVTPCGVIRAHFTSRWGGGAVVSTTSPRIWQSSVRFPARSLRLTLWHNTECTIGQEIKFLEFFEENLRSTLWMNSASNYFQHEEIIKKPSCKIWRISTKEEAKLESFKKILRFLIKIYTEN